MFKCYFFVFIVLTDFSGHRRGFPSILLHYKAILMILHLYPCQGLTHTNLISLKSRANRVRVPRPQRLSHADPDEGAHYPEIE